MEGQIPLSELFSPRGVAVVGVTLAGGRSFARQVVEALQEARFPAIYPVNSRYKEFLGLPCYPNLTAIPGPVDHVIVAIPAESALGLLDDCITKGVKSVHFFTAGFSETGDMERANLEKAILRKARAGGLRLFGPNCVGLYVPRGHLATITGLPQEPGPIAFISQSGGYANFLPYIGAPRGLRFSKVVSYGNALDVDESELLQFLAEDPESEIIGAYIEGVKDGKRFRTALKYAASRKPVVLLSGGTTEAGRRTTFGHTASLSTPAAVFQALCRQTGAIQVSSLSEMADVLVALRFIGQPPAGNGVAVAGAGGGPSVSAGDEMEKVGQRLPPLSAATQTELKKFLPLAGTIFGNPVDATNLTSAQIIAATMGVLSRLPEIDTLVYHMGFHPISRWGDGRFASPEFLRPAADALKEVRQTTGKPVMLVLCPAPDLRGAEEFLAVQAGFVSEGFPVFHSFAGAARALGLLSANRKPANPCTPTEQS